MASTSRLLFLSVLGAIGIALGACASPAVQECGATGVLCPSGTHCAAAEGICLPDTNTCGDAHLDPGEVCDDGNTKDGDGCSHDCMSDEKCGNGIVDVTALKPEVCDDGNTKDGDGCSHDCLSLEKCGNGIVDINEECDDGNAAKGDGCSPTCRLEKCGNGIVDPGEACDLLPVDLTKCSADCLSNRMCGNGKVDPGEECDNGPDNANNADCRLDCVVNRCGDGFLNTVGGGPGHLEHVEKCEAGAKAVEFSRDVTSPESQSCNADCSLPSCGDGKLNRQFTPAGAAGPEQCDNAGANGDTADCTSKCQTSTCGDGLTNSVGPLLKEGCDDGNRNDSDACSNGCIASTCGDGIVRHDVNPALNEECDLGVGTNSDTGACLTNCKLAKCGDGKIEAGIEQCDGGAGCSSACKLQVCGNGIIDPGEQCDDGNAVNGDGCTAGLTSAGGCKIEFCGDGLKNNNSPTVHEACDSSGIATSACNINCTAPSCGDGIVNHAFTPSGAAGPEQCDPPNPGNGCTAKCQFELCGNGVVDPGEDCDGAAGPGPCSASCFTQVCGNGIIDPGEQCDLGAGKNGLTGACPACQLAKCGDGHIETGVEDCDGGASCSATCHAEVCGNGIVDTNEECDDGTGNSDTGDCRADCIINRCGDGHINMTGSHPEACDGGPVAGTGSHTVTPTNTLNCNSDCTAPTCGDGKLNTTAKPDATHFEQCEPPSPGNGCSALCQLEKCGNNVIDSGEECDGGAGCDANCTLARCGNHIIDTGEACDDGNSTNGDGCDNNCTISNTCGNGIINAGEVCDDHNTTCGACKNDCTAVTSQAATGLIFAAPATALHVSGDTFVIDDGSSGTSAVTFEILRPTGTSAGGTTTIALADTDDATAVATKIKNAIAAKVAIGIDVTAVGGAVILHHRKAVTAGNKTITTNIAAGTGFLTSGMSGALGGNCNTGQKCTQALDCASLSCVNGSCT